MVSAFVFIRLNRAQAEIQKFLLTFFLLCYHLREAARGSVGAVHFEGGGWRATSSSLLVGAAVDPMSQGVLLAFLDWSTGCLIAQC